MRDCGVCVVGAREVGSPWHLRVAHAVSCDVVFSVRTKQRELSRLLRQKNPTFWDRIKSMKKRNVAASLSTVAHS